MKNNLKVVFSLTALIFLYGCSSGSSAPQEAPSETMVLEDHEAGMGAIIVDTSPELANGVLEQNTGESYETKSETVEKKKIITGKMNIETKQFDFVLNQIEWKLSTVSGYIESANLSTYTRYDEEYKTTEMVLKIPAQNFREVKEEILTLANQTGKVKVNTEAAKDVTAEYYDAENRLKTKTVEEQRLLELIDKADKIEDLLVLERRLGEVRTEIELYQSSIKNIDRNVAFSTIYLGITEVKEGKIIQVDNNFSSTVKNSFTNSINSTVRFLQDVIIFLVSMMVPIVIMVVILAIIVTILKKNKRRRAYESDEQESS